jgi:hypothetical protein
MLFEYKKEKSQRRLETGMVVHICDPLPWKAEIRGSWSEASPDKRGTLPEKQTKKS